MAYPVTTIIVPMTLETYDSIIPMTIQEDTELIPMQFSSKVEIRGDADYFDGPYEYTPSEQTQIIPIIDYIASDNIVINPIPQNYGLITYNGINITVS